jgi:hypothetical protein
MPALFPFFWWGAMHPPVHHPLPAPIYMIYTGCALDTGAKGRKSNDVTDYITADLHFLSRVSVLRTG